MTLTLLAIALGWATAEPVLAPAPQERPKLICRDGEQLTGTRIRTGRRCKTAEQWQQEDTRLDQIPPTLVITKGQEDGHRVERPQ